jgi:hypothetical protein
LVQDVAVGDANCVHQTVVPYPGGFDAPPFCLAALGLTIQLTQTGCGVGRIDSDGGSDFTLMEDADTSDFALCNTQQFGCPSAAPDPSGRLDVTVGNGIADACPGGGSGNAVATVPVETLTWIASSCPDSDGTFNPESDTIFSDFLMILDLTTDATTARFTDLDGDGCALSGIGPIGLPTGTGSCLDPSSSTLTAVTAGAVFSSVGPLYDLTYSATLPFSVSGPAPPEATSCSTPPAINFDGVQTRCLF